MIDKIEVNKVYVHTRSKNRYKTLLIANQSLDQNDPKFPWIVTYLSEKDGKLYARPYTDFQEKFTKDANEI